MVEENRSIENKILAINEKLFIVLPLFRDIELSEYLGYSEGSITIIAQLL